MATGARQPGRGYSASCQILKDLHKNLGDTRNVFTFGYVEVQRLCAVADTAAFALALFNFLFLLMSTEIFREIASGVTEKCCCKQDGASKMTGKFCRKLNNELLTQKQRIIF